MTRKHYNIVAEAVSNITDMGERWRTANTLANNFEADNPRFDRVRFIDACRPEDNQNE